MRWIPVTLVVLVAAGCGSTAPPRLQHADATRLIALTHKIAGEGACAQNRDIPTLRSQAFALVNAHRVPAALQEPLLSGVQALGAEAPVCLPSVPVSTTPAPTVAAPAHPKPPPGPHPHPQPPKPPKPPHPPHGHHHGNGP
ncbi:MAG TPA: hypothetical protein VHV52_14815 [Gaiellaceae bacterium]|nr:hypothetical protein [Gaiellaceae bacterium]